MVKDLAFCDAQKSSQECENRGVNTIEGGAPKKSVRKGESFGDEVDGLVAEVVAKRGDPDAQECGGRQDCGKLSVKIKTQFTGWIRLPLLDGGTELVHVRSCALQKGARYGPTRKRGK
jgi:hypothetical protein